MANSNKKLSPTERYLKDDIPTSRPKKKKLSRKNTEEIRLTPDALKLLTAIEIRHKKLVEQIGFSSYFIKANQDFVKSDQAVVLALRIGDFETAESLIRHGYYIHPDILVNSILTSDKELVSHLIRGSYTKDEVELEYWLMIYIGWLDIAEDLRFQNAKLNAHYDRTIYSILFDRNLITKALKAAIVRSYDDLAGLIVKIYPEALTGDMVEIVLNKNSIDFLRRLWVGDHSFNASRPIKKRKANGKLKNVLTNVLSPQQKIQVNKKMRIHLILRTLLENKRITEAQKVLTWPEALEQPRVLETLILHGQQELATYVIKNQSSLISLKDFELCMQRKLYSLAIQTLTHPGITDILNSEFYQRKILELLKNGQYCIFAAKMLGVLNCKNWEHSLTKELCEIIKYLIKKSNEILKCKQPILMLVLLAEFLKKIIPLDIINAPMCQRSLNLILSFAEVLENNFREEEVLQFYLLHSDISDRSALAIISFNDFTDLLKNDEIGSIVARMWAGARKNVGIVKASTIHKTSEATNIEGAMAFKDRIDRKKPYLFQFDQWTESCKLRFVGQAVSTLILVCLYSLMIQYATLSGNMEDVSKDPTALIFLRISQIWIAGLMIEKVLHYLFQVKTNRTNLIDKWAVLDMLMFLQMIFLMLELNKEYAGEGKLISFLEPKDFNSLMHGLMLAMIWTRVLSVLISTILYGSLLKMIAMIISRLTSYFVLLFIILFSCAVIFTIFFGETNSDTFGSFSVSFRTLFAAAYNSYDMEQFQGQSNRFFGEISFGIFIIFLFVLMKNFLIAILANTYEELSVKVETEYKSTLIALHNKWKWDENYGVLIMLPSPMSWIVVLIAPVFLFAKNPKPLNNFFARLFFVLFVVPQFLLFAILSALYFPSAFFTSLVAYARTGRKKKIKRIDIIKDAELGEEENNDGFSAKPPFSYRRACGWFFVGTLILLGAYLRDLLDFWTLIYISHEGKEQKTSLVLNNDFFKTLQKYLKSIKSETKDWETFVEEFVELDTKNISAALQNNTNYMAYRGQIIEEFLSHFINSRREPIIDIPLMKTLLTKEHFYSKNYIKEAKQIYVPWVAKAIENYNTLMGGIMNQGILIPKSYVTGEIPQIKRTKFYLIRSDIACSEFKDISINLSAKLNSLTNALYNVEGMSKSIDEIDEMSKKADLLIKKSRNY